MGLRGRLLLLVLVPTIPGLIVSIHSSFQQRRFGRSKAEQDAVRIVQLAAVQEQGLIEAAKKQLLALTTFPEARATNVNFQGFFARLVRLFPDYTDFGLIETNGALVACASGNSGSTNLGDRAFFQSVLRHQDLGIGTYDLAPGSGKPSLIFGYPIKDEQQQVVRVVYAALDLAVVNRSMSKTPLPKNWMISLLDARGVVLARAPDAERWLGKAFASPSLLGTMRSRKEGTAEMPEDEGSTRLCAFTQADPGPDASLFVAAGIPLAVAYAEPHRTLLMNLAVLGGIAGLALAAAWFYAEQSILRPLRALAITTRQVTAGDLSARTGLGEQPGELNQLAHAFDEMAESLQAQRRQNERFHAELEERVKQRTAELEQSNKELEAFSYSVSHDLRAPLRHIHGYVGRLHDQTASTWTEEEHRLLKLISEAAKRMGMLIDDLLAFSRMGRVQLDHSRVPMGEIVGEVLADIQRETGSGKIRWSISDLPEVEGDRSLLKQVWANLLSNAAKYSRNREIPEIRISFREQNGDYEFEVRDNGAGFDMRYAHKLFRVFERLHRAEEFEGTGIGLANVRRIILRHGGRTWAEGHVDEGATFYFTLPRRS